MIYRKKLLLASASPRRQYLLKELGFDFTVEVRSVDEVYPPELKREQIPLYLSQLKAAQFKNTIDDGSIVITADTIVWINGKEIGKPRDRAHAVEMLKILSGNMHEVVTAVTLTTKNTAHSFYVESKVYFKPFLEKDIINYVETFKPFDKAGSYGLQDCLPAIVNPCSAEEKEFLNKLGKPNLYKSTYPKDYKEAEGIGIEKIEGSYFNVMGLPIKELYEELGKMLIERG